MAGNSNSGGDTRFGGERANPRATDLGIKTKPGSIRGALRHISAQDIELPEDWQNKTKHELAKIMLPKKPTMGQVAAAVRFAAELLNGGADGLIEQIDGKLPQVNVNAEFAELMGMTDDELLAIAARTTGNKDSDGSAQDSSSQLDSGSAIYDAPASSGETREDNPA